MAPWGSQWLETSANYEAAPEETDRTQSASTSGRQHGGRWLNMVQGIRRSLDVHLKSYYKIDSAYTACLKHTSASDKLRALARGLAATGLAEFCCVYLVHPTRGTFGTVALSGPGAELYPALLTGDASPHWTGSGNTGSSTSPTANFFSRAVFQVQDSNWAVEDVVASKVPWYYDCASAANGYGLPQEASWLRRAGMRSVLALPCMHGQDVYGVMVVATKHKTLDHLLLRKLEELCYKVTPTIVDATLEHVHVLGNRRYVSRYESVSDFAHAVLGEMLNLDRAVAQSICTGDSARCGGGASGVTGPINASQVRQAQRQQSIKAAAAAQGGKAGKHSGSGKFDAAAAVAAAAAAGFTWSTGEVAAGSGGSKGSGSTPAPAGDAPFPTTPSLSSCFARLRQGRHGHGLVAASSSSGAAAPAPAPVAPQQQPCQQQQQQAELQQEQQAPAAGELVLLTQDTFASALTGTMTFASSNFTLTHGDMDLPPQAAAQGCGTSPVPSPLPSTAPALVAPPAAPAPAAACPPAGELAAQLLVEHVRHRQVRTGAATGVAPCGAERQVSRSTRSLSCIELSSGLPDDVVAVGGAGEQSQPSSNEALPAAHARASPNAGSGSGRLPCGVALRPTTPTAVQAAAAARLFFCEAPAAPAAPQHPHQQQQQQHPVLQQLQQQQQPSCRRAGAVPAQPEAPVRVQGWSADGRPAAAAQAGAAHSPASASGRSTESGSSPFMMDHTADSSDLGLSAQPHAFMLRGGLGNASLTGSHVMHRGKPLEGSATVEPLSASLGPHNLAAASGPASAAAAAAGMVPAAGHGGPGSAAALAARLEALAAAYGSGTTCATGYTATVADSVQDSSACNTAALHSAQLGAASASVVPAGADSVCRWSRESAAAAAAMWGTEAAEAVAAAVRYSAGCPAPYVPPTTHGSGRAGSAAGGKPTLGGLYGIAESGPLLGARQSSGLGGSLSGSDDGGVTMTVSLEAGSARGVVLAGAGSRVCGSAGGSCSGEVAAEALQALHPHGHALLVGGHQDHQPARVRA